MAVIQITQYSSDGATTKVNEVIEKLGNQATIRRLAIGTRVQTPNTIQVVLEREALSSADAASSPLLTELENTFGGAQKSFQVDISPSPFSADSPATVEFVEYVTTWFPVSQATPEFRRNIESEFMKFNEVIMREADGRIGLSIGWGVEEQDNTEVKNEKAVPFFAMTGWRSMQQFEKLTKTDSFKEAAPILMGWGAPYQMVSIRGFSHDQID